MSKPKDTEARLVAPADMPALAHRARQAAGLTQEAAAERLRVAQSIISRAENDPSGRYVKVQARMIQELGGWPCEGPLYRIELPKEDD